ncbi:MAG TPA: hypothetical protein VNU46_09530, partial [Gemmatimonadaceae bacterium]|nr:hypothetical protein [Gemmatimonadaceae bacterium]
MTTPVEPQHQSYASPAGAFEYRGMLQQMVQQNASDLHLKVGLPPTLRINGELVTLDLPPIRVEDVRALAEQTMTAKQLKEFAEAKECDYAIGVTGIGRFRVNAFLQRGT